MAELWYKQLRSAQTYIELAQADLQHQRYEASKLLSIADAHQRLADRSEKTSNRLLRKVERVNTRRIKTERKLHTKENY